jgi:hypothetical protein
LLELLNGMVRMINSAVDSGGVELILTAVGLPAAAVGSGDLQKGPQTKK